MATFNSTRKFVSTRTFVEKTCESCEEKFKILACDANRGRGRFCSEKCYLTWKSATLKERIKRHTGSKDSKGCILWNGCKSNRYIKISQDGNRNKSLLAHRVAWEIANGRPVPDGLIIMHTCDNKRCVNPEHLIPGTCKKNMEDASSKGRMAHGKRHWASKLSDKKVIEARRLYESGNYTQQQLADKFGVTVSSMNSALIRKTWKHI